MWPTLTTHLKIPLKITLPNSVQHVELNKKKIKNNFCTFLTDLFLKYKNTIFGLCYYMKFSEVVTLI